MLREDILTQHGKTAACAIWQAVKDVRNKEDVEVPKEMKDAHYKAAAELGYGSYHDGMCQESYRGVDKRYVKPEVWNAH